MLTVLFGFASLFTAGTQASSTTSNQAVSSNTWMLHQNPGK
jgi:hypothetical protein